MRWLKVLFLLCLAVALTGCGSKGSPLGNVPSSAVRQAAAAGPPQAARRYIQLPSGMTPGVDYREDEIIVGFDIKGFSSPTSPSPGGGFNRGAMLNPVLYENEAIASFAREIEQNHNIAIIPNAEGYVRSVNFCAYKLAPGRDANDAARDLRIAYPARVKYVEYNGIVRLLYFPDDPFYQSGDLWGMDAISAPLAWDITKGDSEQKIAVIDSGIYTNPAGTEFHEDLYNWVRIPGINTDLIDDDEIPEDVHGHGTHVAGTIAAIGDNATGVVGLAYESVLLPIKVFSATKYAGSGALAYAILLASAAGCSVINMSLGDAPTRTVAEACAQVFEDGVVVVAAAGNANVQAPSYPGGYPWVINVGASDVNDGKASYSNYGLTVDIVAPGGDDDGDTSHKILSTTFVSNSSYGYKYGTSMASPHVAGAAALIMANEPAFTPLEVRALIEYYGDDVLDQGEWQAAVPLYRLNAYEPLNYSITGLPTVAFTSHGDGESISGDVVLRVDANASTAVAGVHFYVDGQYYAWDNSEPYEWAFNTGMFVPGVHTFTAEVLDTENAHGYHSVNLDVDEEGLPTPYWTGYEDETEREGWLEFGLPTGDAEWQFDSEDGNTYIYFGDPDKPGGRGYSAGDFDVLVTPSFDLAGTTNPALYITAKWDLDYRDIILIKLLSSSGEDTVLFYFYFQNDNWPEWSAVEFDLSDYSGSIVRFEFWTYIDASSGGGQGYWLDDFVVSDSQAPPEITISSPAAGALVQGTVPLAAGVTDDNDVVLASDYWIDSSLIQSFIGAPSEVLWDSTTVSDGDHDFNVYAVDELTYYDYDVRGFASRSIYVHNTPPQDISVAPSAAPLGYSITVTGTHFGRWFDGECNVYFTGSDGEVAASVESWTDTSIECTVPLGAVDGPLRVKIGSLSGLSSSDFDVVPAIEGFAFASPSPGRLIDGEVEFSLTPQPYASRVEFEIIDHPEIVIPDDTTPETISFSLSPEGFLINGKYDIQATAFSVAAEVSVSLEFFVEVLPGDFDANGIVAESDLDFLRSHLWETPADSGWLAYLDSNRNGLIDEADALLVGYYFGETR